LFGLAKKGEKNMDQDIFFWYYKEEEKESMLDMLYQMSGIIW
jgi:hypothetical protein